VTEVYEALTVKENMRQMVNSNMLLVQVGMLCMFVVTQIRRSPTQVAKEIVARGVAPSQRDDKVIYSACTARREIMKFKIAGTCRMRRGTTHPSQKVKLMVDPLLSLMIVRIMVMFLLPLLDVFLMMSNGYLILLTHIMPALIELCLGLMNPCRMMVLFRWAIVLLVRLLPSATSRLGCLMGLCTH
jgi:hypothetical protein